MTKEEIARKLYAATILVAKETISLDLDPWEKAEYSRNYWTKVVNDVALYEELSIVQSPIDLHNFHLKVETGSPLVYIETFNLRFIEEIKWFREYVHPPENSLMGKRFRLLVSKRRFEFICNGTLTGDVRFLDGRKETLTIQMKDLREISEEE